MPVQFMNSSKSCYLLKVNIKHENKTFLFGGIFCSVFLWYIEIDFVGCSDIHKKLINLVFFPNGIMPSRFPNQ